MPLSACKIKIITWLLLLIMPILGMAVDLISPALPSMTQALNTPESLIKQLIASYILGYGIGNFTIGILSDSLGRRKIMLISFIIVIIASILPGIITHINLILAMRFIQGLAFGAISVLIRASLVDILKPEQLVRVGSLLGTMWGIGPVFGPLIGGYLTINFGWTTTFFFIAMMSTTALIAYYLLVPETKYKRISLNYNTLQSNIIILLKDPFFIGLSIMMGLAYSLIISFHTIAPFFIQTTLHYSTQFFSHLALGLGLIFLATTFIGRKTLTKYGVATQFKLTINLALAGILISLGVNFFYPNQIYLTMAFSGLMFYICGGIFPFAMGRGMALHKEMAGTLGALMFFINTLITSIISFIESFININTSLNYLFSFGLIICLLWLNYLSLVKPYLNNSITHTVNINQ